MHDINPAARPEQSPEFAHAWFAHRSLSLKLHSLGLYPHILRSLTPARGGVIADFGCGAGELTSELASALAPSELTAIDVNPYLLQRCRDICGDRVTTHCQDIASPSLLRSHSVDGLVCSNVVMHLSDDECARLFKEIYRVLSPSRLAVVVLTHPLWAQLNYGEQSKDSGPLNVVRNWGGVELLQRYRSISDYRTLAHEAGLSITDESVIGIPEDAELSNRYREHTGHPIFFIAEVRIRDETS